MVCHQTIRNTRPLLSKDLHVCISSFIFSFLSHLLFSQDISRQFATVKIFSLKITCSWSLVFMSLINPKEFVYFWMTISLSHSHFVSSQVTLKLIMWECQSCHSSYHILTSVFWILSIHPKHSKGTWMSHPHEWLPLQKELVREYSKKIPKLFLETLLLPNSPIGRLSLKEKRKCESVKMSLFRWKVIYIFVVLLQLYFLSFFEPKNILKEIKN